MVDTRVGKTMGRMTERDAIESSMTDDARMVGTEAGTPMAREPWKAPVVLDIDLSGVTRVSSNFGDDSSDLS